MLFNQLFAWLSSRARTVVGAPVILYEPLEERRLMSVTAYSVQPIGYEESAPGVSASWSTRPWEQWMANDSASLTLTGLPEGYVVRVSGRVDFGNTYDGQDINNLSISAGSEEVTLLAGVHGDELPMRDFTLDAESTGGSSFSVGLSGSGIEQQDGEGWSLLDMTIEVFQYRISVGAQTLTVGGDSEEVGVTVTKEDGSPAAGVSVDIESLNSGVVRADQSSVTTDGNGTATVDVSGITPGYAMLQAKAGGGQAQAQQVALQITKRDTKPGEQQVQDELAKLDEDFGVRSAAEANLLNWLRQYPELYDVYKQRGDDPNASDQLRTAIESILGQTQLTLTLDGNRLKLDLSRLHLNPGETAMMARWSSDSDSLLIDNGARGARIWGTGIPPGGPSVKLLAEQAGLASITVEVTIESAGSARTVTTVIPLLIRDNNG